MHVDDVGLGIEMMVPDLFQQHGARDDMPGMPHQIFEQAELARQQVDRLARPRHAARDQVHFEIGDLEPGLGAAAAGQRLEPRQKLGEGEGLAEIIVAARAQALDAVLDVAHGAQHQNRGLVIGRAQGGDDRQPVEARQHAVDDHGVEAAVARAFEAVAAFVGVVHAMAAFGQALQQIGGGLAVVLDQQDAHGDSA